MIMWFYKNKYISLNISPIDNLLSIGLCINNRVETRIYLKAMDIEKQLEEINTRLKHIEEMLEAQPILTEFDVKHLILLQQEKRRVARDARLKAKEDRLKKREERLSSK